MNVLGICASYRKLGNTEILIREALQACSVKGAETEFVRLTDFNINPCKGCMACIFRNEECKIEDDMSFLLETMEEYDCLILGSPTYLLSPPGSVKLVLDRFFMAQTRFKGKRASTIGVAALPEWEPLLLPMLNMLVLSFGYELIDSHTFYGAGPGEVLLDEKNLEMARTMGERLVSGNSNSHAENVCPVCRATFISLKNMKCPICGLTLSVKNGKVIYDPPVHHRFTEEGFQEHMENWILRTEGRYFSHLEDIRQMKEKYRQG
jgi:putative NADPH-quinone reductase